MCFAQKILLIFDGKLTAQSSVFCSVTDHPGMLLRNNTALACTFLVKSLR
ncbi:MAG: hypothetical protein IKA29_02965 [Clostridia bacterium]|nr:hypothetical protein [Clostridia bacterium]